MGWLEEIKGDSSIMLTHFFKYRKLINVLHAKLNLKKKKKAFFLIGYYQYST